MVSKTPTRRRVVLFLPHRADPARGEVFSADLLPLELLQIASGPVTDGFEVVLIDAMIEPRYVEKVLEACDGALCFASSCILGYQVYDGYVVAKAVREKYPNLPIVWGGWFPSVTPEMYLDGGIADAVALGQGELTFREVVNALDAGEPLDSVAGLALKRDGKVVYTDHREVVGFEKFEPVPWHLLEYERYATLQTTPTRNKVRHRFPLPGHWTVDNPPRGFSYFSSFGCPEPCKFCCSPFVTNRRWKAMPAERMLDQLQDLQERWGYQVVRFHDANFGVMEKRVREFSQGILDRGMKLWWNSFIETHSILHYDPTTLDLMARSGMHLAEIGAETGTDEFMKTQIGKPIKGDDNVRATYEMEKRGIENSVTYIIGFPRESPENMLETLDQARRAQAAAPKSSVTVWPYRPIPGTEMWDQAIELGFEAPNELEHWGSLGEYHLHETWPGRIPPNVAQVRKLYCHYQTLARGLVRQKDGLWERLARWRLQTGNYALGGLETKLFMLWLRLRNAVAKPEPEISRSWVDPGHKTGTGANEAAKGIDQKRVVSDVTIASRD